MSRTWLLYIRIIDVVATVWNSVKFLAIPVVQLYVGWLFGPDCNVSTATAMTFCIDIHDPGIWGFDLSTQIQTIWLDCNENWCKCSSFPQDELLKLC